MRGAVPVLFSAHLITNVLTRQVSASNPALRIPPSVRVALSALLAYKVYLPGRC